MVHLCFVNKGKPLMPPSFDKDNKNQLKRASLPSENQNSDSMKIDYICVYIR